MLNIRTPKPVYKVFPSAVSFLLTQRRHWVFMTWQLLPFRRATFANHRHCWHKKYKMGTDLRWKHFPPREKNTSFDKKQWKIYLKNPKKANKQQVSQETVCDRDSFYKLSQIFSKLQLRNFHGSNLKHACRFSQILWFGSRGELVQSRAVFRSMIFPFKLKEYSWYIER